MFSAQFLVTLHAPGHAPSELFVISERPGMQIGPYKLLQEIGEGGFGVVWAAEQRKPVKRRVALKVIKLGMDTRQVIARFEAERQALALMNHPNIALVLDAGTIVRTRRMFSSAPSGSDRVPPGPVVLSLVCPVKRRRRFGRRLISQRSCPWISLYSMWRLHILELHSSLRWWRTNGFDRVLAGSKWIWIRGLS